MAASLKQMAQCIGVSGNISILKDFYGYITGAPAPLSLLKQIKLLKGKHIELNLIRVGIESFTNSDEIEIDAAVQFTRDTYATVNLGISRVRRYFITTADANGAENIDNDAEAQTLTEDWTVPNGAFDVFLVLTYATSTIGLSPTEGPCDKNEKGMNGSVVAIEGNTLMTGQTLAHELGHYLGLDQRFAGNHSTDPNNLMFASGPNGGTLDSVQGQKMRQHCFVYAGC